jgi:glycosyltransferase involved in cell wall biosynthesis
VHGYPDRAEGSAAVAALRHATSRKTFTEAPARGAELHSPGADHRVSTSRMSDGPGSPPDFEADEELSPLVSVVVPAFNAAKTIDETLWSVREQTYSNLEILVVDDGSIDDTALHVEEHARRDHRVHLIRQENGGVAAARNRGIAAAKGDFIAPIDADDLWIPTKIEKQMMEMLSAGPSCGLVYTWQARIDKQGRITSLAYRKCIEGDVFTRMLFENILGCGSTALIRKQAILESGGYDTSLRARGAQGCEDYKLYLQISERYEFAVVKEHLTGYRRTPRAMSTDVPQMLRSHTLVAEYAKQAHPRYASLVKDGLAHYYQRQFVYAVRNGFVLPSLMLLPGVLRRDLRWLSGHLLRAPAHASRIVAGWTKQLLRLGESAPVFFLPRPNHKAISGSCRPFTPVGTETGPTERMQF